ncbi:hypothetical protein MJH12_19250 [bacterium]|nr:hypothetical protein [bacterium]
MNKKVLFTLGLLLTSFQIDSHANEIQDKVILFSNSVTRNLGFRMNRFKSVAAKLGNIRAKRLTKYTSSGTLALYDKSFNQVLFEDKMLYSDGDI